MRHFAAQKLATGFAKSESKFRLQAQFSAAFCLYFLTQVLLFTLKLPKVSEAR